jgi:hypothetical protein
MRGPWIAHVGVVTSTKKRLSVEDNPIGQSR